MEIRTGTNARSSFNAIKMAAPSSECPCCHQSLPVIDRVEVDLNINAVIFGGKVMRAPPRTAEFIFLLASNFPRTVPHDTIISKIWSANADIVDRIIDNQATLARLILRKLGWDVISERSIGYRLARFEPKGRRFKTFLVYDPKEKINGSPAHSLPQGAMTCETTSSAAAGSTEPLPAQTTSKRLLVVLPRHHWRLPRSRS